MDILVYHCCIKVFIKVFFFFFFFFFCKWYETLYTRLVMSCDTIIIFKFCKQRIVNINTGILGTIKNEMYHIVQTGVLAE